MSSSRNPLTRLVEQGSLAPEDVDEALDVLEIRPDSDAWRTFIDLLLLWIGGLALAFAALFFIAHNWSEIGRFAKFGLLQGAVILATAVYWKLGPESTGGRVSLLVAAILLGVLLAFIGQTYQTGADPWQLFFYWALLILPWALVGRFAAIWILWVLLINLSLILYHSLSSLLLPLAGYTGLGFVWQLFIFNTLALFVWELAARTWKELAVRWATRLLAALGGIPITWLTLCSFFSGGFSVPVTTVWGLWLAGMYLVYRRLRPDLFMLAGGCLSGILVLAGFANQYVLMSARESFASAYLLVALMVIGLGTASASWLKKIHREYQS